MGLRVAVVGATGNVGREMLSILYERSFPYTQIAALASQNSVGTPLPAPEGKELFAEALEDTDLSVFDLCLMSAGGEVAQEWAPRFAETGAVVIDNSSAFRYEADVPLIVPEVNPEALSVLPPRRLIANPNCSTAQLVVALKPLHDFAGIRRVVVSTYQSVSGAGKEAMEALFRQSRALFSAQEKEEPVFSKPIAFNVIPHIDSFMEDGTTREEWKVVVETQKILDPAIKVSCTAVRVPVSVGHAEAVNIECARPLSVEKARALLEAAPGCCVVDTPVPGGYATPRDCAGQDPVYISRIRRDSTVAHGLNFWVVADNLRKGAALNAVQIAELLVERKLISGKKL